MYTVLWTTTDIHTGKSVDRWERCDSRREVAALLIKYGLENDEDVIIFGPDAEDHVLTQEDIFMAL